MQRLTFRSFPWKVGSVWASISWGGLLGPGERSTGDAGWMYVSEHYFKALEIPLKRGRVFNERDGAGSPRVVVINESFAKKYWPKADSLGQRIEIGKQIGPDFAEGPREIVGIVGDVKEAGLGNPAPEVMYIPLAQLKDSFTLLNNKIIPMTWVVKTAVEPLTLSSAIQKQVLSSDSQLAVAHIRPANQVVSEATARQDFDMKLLTVFAGTALLLAANRGVRDALVFRAAALAGNWNPDGALRAEHRCFANDRQAGNDPGNFR